MHPMFENYLQQIGLSEKEAEVYVALLKYDNASVGELSQKTKVNRTTIYPVLESLSKKGLVSEVQVDKKTHYQAEPPERLETYVQRQKVVLEENAKRLSDIVPQLKGIQRESGSRPIIKFFEGRDGVISSLEDFFKSKNDSREDTVYFLYPKDLINDIFTKEERTRFLKYRIDRDLKSKAFYTYSDVIVSEDGSERKRINEKKYPVLCDISIYGDMVKINTLGKTLSAINITNSDLATTLKSLFNLAFDNYQEEK